jgi:hypothetical protein
MQRTDEEYHREVNDLLKSLMRLHSIFEGSYRTFTNAADALRAEAERGGNSANLRQALDRANKAGGIARGDRQRVADNLQDLRDLLRLWKSPGRDYAQHADEVWQTTQQLVETYNRKIGPDIRNILDAIEAIDEGAR